MAAEWHPARKLRQLESVAGRALLAGVGGKDGTPAALHCVTLAACDVAGGAWQVLYRSEAARGGNPEWRPLAWTDEQLLAVDPLLDGSDVQVLLALHAVEPCQSGGGSQEAAAGQADPTRPLLPAAADRPAFQLALPTAASTLAEAAAAEQQAEEARQQHQQTDTHQHTHQDQQQQAEQSPLASKQQAEQPRPLEQRGEAPVANGDAVKRASGGDNDQQQRGSMQDVQQQAADVKAKRVAAGTDSLPANGDAAAAEGAPLRSASEGPDAAADADGAAAAAAALAALEPAAAPSAAPSAAAEAASEEGSGSCVAAALAGTGCCPGRLVAAWQLGSLEALFPAGTDLAALQCPLHPNTLVLQLGDGAYLCPPPLQQEQERSVVPASHHASPLKRAAGGSSAAATVGDEAPAAPASPMRRGFASLLVSKLLRSAPNLQEVAGGSAGADAEWVKVDAGSDVESEAGSEGTTATAASRLTSATAASELPAGGVAGGGRGAAAAPAAALASGSGGTRVLTLAGVHQCIASLAALQGRLRDVAGRSQAVQAALEARLDPARRQREQAAALAALAGEAVRCRQRAAQVAVELGEVRSATAAVQKQGTVRAQALVTTLKVMQSADRRVSDAAASLAGEEGRGALAGAMRELVARRCQMVCQLGAIFQLGPAAVSILEAPPGGFLEERLEQQWAGAADPTLGYDAPSGFGSGGAVDGPSLYRQEMRLSIGGLEVRPSVWRRAFEDGGGSEGEPGEDRAAAMALGYVAQVVDRLAAYLGVPLRYPLALCGSRSAVVDSHPPVGAWLSAEAGAAGVRQPFFGRADSAAAAAAASDWGGPGGAGGGSRPAEFPLYCDSNRERPRFAVGVFLLNKDVIQLLQAHGISAAGPNCILHNLHKLLLAAQSALPHLPPALGAATAALR